MFFLKYIALDIVDGHFLGQKHHWIIAIETLRVVLGLF